MMCRYDHISDELERTLGSSSLESAPQNTEKCCCCSCQKKSAKGKFGLAYIVETPRHKYTQPLGWELEFEDSPSNISNSCKKMTQWANRPPIGECLEKETHLYCRPYEITTGKCCCDQCVIKSKKTVYPCYQDLQLPKCCCEPKICYCCYNKLQKLQNCRCKFTCLSEENSHRGNQDCSCIVPSSCQKDSQEYKPCKCNRHTKYVNNSPEQKDDHCREARSKSRHRRKKVREYDCLTGSEDNLDYIPRKETCSKKKDQNRSRGRRQHWSKDRTCAREKDKKSNCTMTEKLDSSDKYSNLKGPGPTSESDKLQTERNSRSEKSPDDKNRNSIRGDTQLNNTLFNNTIGNPQTNYARGTTQPNSIRGDSQMNRTRGNNAQSDNLPQNTQMDTSFNNFQRDVFLNSSRRESLEPSRDTTVKRAPDSTVS